MAFAAPIIPFLPLIAAGVGVASAAVGAAATISANNYQKQVAQRNKALALENARRAETQAQADQLAQDMKTRELLGQQIATQSASGLKLGGRSQMLTRKAARELGRMDALNVRREGDVTRWNYEQIANDEASKIKQYNSANGFALLSGFLDAAGAGVSGLSSKSTQSLLGGSKLAGKTPFAQGASIRFAT
jgi:hypothetical protein